jgi:hypothetical protein
MGGAWAPPLNVSQPEAPWLASVTSDNESERRDESTTFTALSSAESVQHAIDPRGATPRAAESP